MEWTGKRLLENRNLSFRKRQHTGKMGIFQEISEPQVGVPIKILSFNLIF